MKKDLIIVGAGGDGRSVAELIQQSDDNWNLLGFLDDAPSKQNKIINGVPVLGKINDVVNYQQSYFVILIGSAKKAFVKKKIVNNFGLNFIQYATIVHPTAVILTSAILGKGTIILPMVTVMANAIIGDHVFIALKSNIGHDTTIGDYVLIGALAGIAGNVTINEGAYIGISSSIKDGITIGEWAIVGMGSVVVKDVAPYSIVAGNPARVIGEVDKI